MSSKETHYNRNEQSGSEDGDKGNGRKRQPLSQDRLKDKAKKNHKERTGQQGAGEERSFRPKNKTERPAGTGDNERGERTFNKREDKPFERREGGQGRPFKGREDKPFRERGEGRTEDRKPFERNGGSEGRPFKGREDRPYKPREEGQGRGEGRKPFERSNNREDRPYKPREEGSKPFERNTNREDRPYKPREEGQGHGEGRKPFERSSNREDRPYKPREERTGGYERKQDAGDKPFKKYVPFEDRKDKKTSLDGDKRKPFSKEGRPAPGKSEERKKAPVAEEKAKKPFEDEDFYEDERPFTRSRKWDEKAKEGPMTLNKYLAHSGVSSRREAASIIKEGKVTVNGEVKTEPGYRVNEGDIISYGEKVMKPQKNLVYILLNKPKDFITTTDDEKGRRTVMDLVANAETDRIYPIGRLDRKTTGVLLMTNDGDLTQKLSHPSYKAKKIYQVTLSENLTKRDFDKIISGVVLEDGLVTVDALAYLEKKNEIGIEIHSGRNRIVRRLFESLGYVVDKLDRVVYAGLTKKNVSRGKWRFLTEKEVINLKHFKS